MVKQRNLHIVATEYIAVVVAGVRLQEERGRADRAEDQVETHLRNAADAVLYQVHHDQHATDRHLLLRNRGIGTGSTHAQAEAHPPKEVTVPEHPQETRLAQGADHQDADADADAVKDEGAVTKAEEAAITVKVAITAEVAIRVADEDEERLDARPARGRGARGALPRNTIKNENTTAAAATETTGSRAEEEEEDEVPEDVPGRVGATVTEGLSPFGGALCTGFVWLDADANDDTPAV